MTNPVTTAPQLAIPSQCSNVHSLPHPVTIEGLQHTKNCLRYRLTEPAHSTLCALKRRLPLEDLSAMVLPQRHSDGDGSPVMAFCRWRFDDDTLTTALPHSYDCDYSECHNFHCDYSECHTTCSQLMPTLLGMPVLYTTITLYGSS